MSCYCMSCLLCSLPCLATRQKARNLIWNLDACSLKLKVCRLQIGQHISLNTSLMYGYSRQFWTLWDTACMSGRGRDNSGNETRAGAGGQWHGNCDDYYECGHEKYDDRVTPVKCHHSQPSRHRRHPHHILWLEPDYLQPAVDIKIQTKM